MAHAAKLRHKLRFGRHTISLPGSRLHRSILGVGLIVGGLFWFLPILGLWMLPLGLLVLSVDFHGIRRLRRRFDRWWGRRRRPAKRAAQKERGPGG
jgi:hypothetical protein